MTQLKLHEGGREGGTKITTRLIPVLSGLRVIMGGKGGPEHPLRLNEATSELLMGDACPARLLHDVLEIQMGEPNATELAAIEAARQRVAHLEAAPLPPMIGQGSD